MNEQNCGDYLAPVAKTIEITSSKVICSSPPENYKEGNFDW